MEPSYTVNQILDRYERDCLEELAERTQKDYRAYIPTLRTWFGERIANEMKPRDFGPFLDVKRGYEHRKRILSVLSAAFTNAVSVWYMIDRNVLRDVKRRPGKPRDRLVTDAEYDGMKALAPLKIQLAMELALLTGQRQGDLLSLRWDQIRDGAIFFQQSKTGKRLAIELSPRLKRVLGKCWQLKHGGREYVLVSNRGGRYTSQGFRATWQRAMHRWLRRTGGQRFSFHDLRALAATKCKTPEEAMRLLGHSNISMTLRVYRRGVERVPSLH